MAIAASCASLGENIYKPRLESYVDMSNFLEKVKVVIQSSPDDFLLFYGESLEKIVQASGDTAETYRESKQRRNGSSGSKVRIV